MRIVRDRQPLIIKVLHVVKAAVFRRFSKGSGSCLMRSEVLELLDIAPDHLADVI